MDVLAVASEIFPLVKTGGLADVVGALPGALAAERVRVRTLVPGYPAVLAQAGSAEAVHRFDALYGAPARILAMRAGALELFVLDAPHLYDRPGNPYLGADGKPWPDNGYRFAALARAAAALARGAVPSFVPALVHAHDWQAGLAIAYVHYAPAPRPATAMTIHNLAFQGIFPPALFAELDLPPQAFSIDGLEYWGELSFLKAGVALADVVTTVSPTYAAEIRTPQMGMGFDGLLRARADRLVGIRNGIDDRVWNPASDPHLASSYDASRLEARGANKAAVQSRLGLAVDPDAPLCAVISRLAEQKGSELVLDALPVLARHGAQLAVLGSGDARLERAFSEAAAAQPQRVAVAIGLDEALAHQLQGGADVLLMPSRFEPCGLTQLVALRYGVVPVVSHVGGLADTVVDATEMALAAGAGSGVHFAPVTREMFEAAIDRALLLRRDRALWRRVQRHAMRTDVSWKRPARAYAALFRQLLAPSVSQGPSPMAVPVPAGTERL